MLPTPTFQEIKNQYYNTRPYDFEDNLMGFPTKTLGSQESRSDISAHLPVLEYFASQCDTVTEFGFRNGESTTAFLSGTKKLVTSCDIYNSPMVGVFKNIDLPCQWEFMWVDTTKIHEMPPTDFLFLDTLHTYDQVKIELGLYRCANKYIGFHDTWSHGEESRDIPGQNGIMSAINEFIDEHREWKIIYKVDFNHGLIILEKQQKEE
jgi:hypothetical protein